MSEDRGEGGASKEPPTEEQVRSALLRFAELIKRLEDDDKLLRSLPFLMGRLGDLRRLLFEYEVRVTERLLPIEDEDEREARRIVREAMEREEDASDDWGSSEWRPGEPEDPDAVA